MASVGVLHTTETTDFENTKRGLIRDGYEPHWLIDPTPGIVRVERMLPDSVIGRALQHLKGDPETNARGGGVIQIEVMGKAENVPNYSDGWFTSFAEILHKICTDSNIPIEFPCGWVPYPKSYGYRASQRLSWSEWSLVKGIIGHQHVPGNHHGDPGDVSRLVVAMQQLIESMQEDIMVWSLAQLGPTMNSVDEIYIGSKRKAIPTLPERDAWRKDLTKRLRAGEDPTATLEYIAYALSEEK